MARGSKATIDYAVYDSHTNALVVQGDAKVCADHLRMTVAGFRAMAYSHANGTTGRRYQIVSRKGGKLAAEDVIRMHKWSITYNGDTSAVLSKYFRIGLLRENCIFDIEDDDDLPAEVQAWADCFNADQYAKTFIEERGIENVDTLRGLLMQTEKIKEDLSKLAKALREAK